MAVPDNGYVLITADQTDAESPAIEEVQDGYRVNILRLFQIVLGNGVDPGDPLIQAGPIPTGGGLPAEIFAQPASLDVAFNEPAGYGPWIEVYSRSSIWLPAGVQGIHIRGDLRMTANPALSTYCEYKMQVIGPGGTDESNVITTPVPTGVVTEEFDLLFSNNNMNAVVTHKILARWFFVNGAVDTSFSPQGAAHELWHHFGQI